MRTSLKSLQALIELKKATTMRLGQFRLAANASDSVKIHCLSAYRAVSISPAMQNYDQLPRLKRVQSTFQMQCITDKNHFT